MMAEGRPSAELRVRAPRSLWPAIVLSVIVFCVLVALGTWQVQRLAWKNALVATIEARVHADPLPLQAVLADGRSIADQEYTRVVLSGVFDHAFERHFFATFEGDSGYYVYAPLKLDTGDFVFVNRGFVPFDRKEASRRAEGQVAARVTVTGLLRAGLTEKPSWLVPDNDPARNIFYWKDIRAMRETSGLPASEPVLGVFVDADATPNPGGLPVGGVTMIDLPNNHLQYAMTWYGLAATLLVIAGMAFFRRRRGIGGGV